MSGTTITGRLRRLAYVLYRRYLKRFRIMESSAYFMKYRVCPLLRGRGDAKYQAPGWRMKPWQADGKPERIALIADEMTRKNFQSVTETVDLTPQNWYAQMEKYRPAMLFCESAWCGLDSSWEYRVFRNKRLLCDNRIALKRILRYCSEAGIPTVFWNKEDPTFFDDPVNSFSDTALLFDYIFTTAKECIPRYRQLGHDARVLPFGFSPELFSPIPLPDGENTAAFFGGWYSDQPARCENMRKVFSFVQAQGLKLVIYDRHWGTDRDDNRYPAEYDEYRKPPVPYERIREEMAHIGFAINVTTETESETMFARRVYEMMACGRMVISNWSLGMQAQFGESVWFVDKPFDADNMQRYIEENTRMVFEKHTWAKRYESILDAVRDQNTKDKRRML